MPLAPGTRVGHFDVLSLIGAGGMGEVYRATDVLLGRHVALKLVSPNIGSDPEHLSRFEREARAASALNHPNIVTVYEVALTGDRPHLAMELIDGTSLRQILNQGALPRDRAVRLAAQMADALAAAHAAGVIHRDLKPENVMVGRGDVVKLLDFGIAKFTDASGDATTVAGSGVLLGTAAYMAPERLRERPADIGADQFAFGLIFWEMLAGSHPFHRATSFETLSAICSEPLPQLPENARDVPVLKLVLERCLAKAPGSRYVDTLDLARDVASAAEAAGGAPAPSGADRPPTTPRAVGVSALAVLPFVNGAADPEADYLCEGITDGIINTLSLQSGLKVMARSTVYRYRAAEGVDPRQAGRDLGVRAVVTGRVLSHAGRLRISTELVDVAEGTQMWGDSYDRPVADLFTVQRDISHEIADRLRTHLTDAGRTNARYVPGTEAYQLYLKGRYYWNKTTPDSIKRAMALMQEATDSDPTFALAYAGLADCYSVLTAGEFSVLAPRVGMSRAKAAAQRAYDLDNQLGEAHTSLGFVRYWFDWDWLGAEALFQRALALKPSNSWAWSWYADLLMAMGRFEAAEREAQRAQEIDPLSPVPMNTLGRIYYYAGDFPRALEQFQRTLDLDPTLVRTQLMMAATLAQFGRLDESVAIVDRAIAASGGSSFMISLRGQLAALAGRRDDAVVALKDLEAMSGQRYVSAYHRAVVHAALGDRSAAIDDLERAFDERSSWLVYVNVSPLLKPLRSEPRFIALLERLGLQ